MKIAILIFVAAIGLPSVALAQGPAERLVGAWEAVEDQGLGPDGEVVARDTTVMGLLVYTPEGRMAVQLMYQARPEVSTANDEVSTGPRSLWKIRPLGRRTTRTWSRSFTR